jgi:hypothetical protein
LMSRLAEVQEHRGSIEEYLQRVSNSRDRRKFLQLNHPQAVLQNWYRDDPKGQEVLAAKQAAKALFLEIASFWSGEAYWKSSMWES